MQTMGKSRQQGVNNKSLIGSVNLHTRSMAGLKHANNSLDTIPERVSSVSRKKKIVKIVSKAYGVRHN